jgi:NAD(P)-dependent dehydrogenase (short-subunit alcohol dehydrogenase family)
MPQLTEKVAIVTGAGRGIGRAIALTFAREGARVVVADNRFDLAQQTAADAGEQGLAIQADVSNEDSVANAGIQRRYFIPELPLNEFQAMLGVNLLGVFLCCKAVLPTLYGKRDGNIIITASDSGKHGYAPNAASKFGVIGFMEALADEARSHRVRVNCICPMGVKTEMGNGLMKADSSPVDMAHFMEPEEIADVALFLASHQSRAIHEQSLQVYGGIDYR